jgi:Predicted Zn-dependent proteases and their inactivated homologs
LQEVLVEAERLGAEFADLRYYRARTLAVTASESREVVNNYGVSEGYALRVLVRGAWGYLTANRGAEGLRRPRRRKELSWAGGREGGPA